MDNFFHFFFVCVCVSEGFSSSWDLLHISVIYRWKCIKILQWLREWYSFLKKQTELQSVVNFLCYKLRKLDNFFHFFFVCVCVSEGFSSSWDLLHISVIYRWKCIKILQWLREWYSFLKKQTELQSVVNFWCYKVRNLENSFNFFFVCVCEIVSCFSNPSLRVAYLS